LSRVDKPERIYDRAREWSALTAFADRTGTKAQLGIVTGRRRQGKTFLLESLTRLTGGFYFGAQQATQTESLRQFGQALADWADLAVPPRFEDWTEAISYLFAMDRARKAPTVIDEFPYLSKDAPALPSILQHAMDRSAFDGIGPSLLLAGSAMSVMGGLLGGAAPLRGRANLELIVRPFDFSTTGRYWQLQDPRLAVLLHSVVGGTPAYRQFVNEQSPTSVEQFDQWVIEHVLSVSSPLLREARYLLDEEADVRDSAVYHSVLAAVAGGNNTRGGIAGYIGRKATDIGHHLNVLEDSVLLRREPDILRSGRSSYQITEPLLTFYQVVMRPEWGRLESGRAEEVWRQSGARFLSQVVGPHFEGLCAEWARSAPDGAFNGAAGEVGSGVLTDQARRQQHQLDLVVLSPAYPGEQRRLLAVGEAKWGEKLGSRHVSRLRRAVELLGQRGYDTSATELLLFSGAGFEPIAERDVRTVEPAELYQA
jgi:uncharacterized protein